MTDRPRPGDLPDSPDHSLPPTPDPGTRGSGPGRARHQGQPAGPEPDRLTADIMTIGSWHQSAPPDGPQPLGTGPDSLTPSQASVSPTAWWAATSRRGWRVPANPRGRT
jgi:hypothetical protein